jgi:hypothetical protein
MLAWCWEKIGLFNCLHTFKKETEMAPLGWLNTLILQLILRNSSDRWPFVLSPCLLNKSIGTVVGR